MIEQPCCRAVPTSSSPTSQTRAGVIPRRDALRLAVVAAVGAASMGQAAGSVQAAPRRPTRPARPRVRIAVAHIAPGAGSLDANRALLLLALQAAAASRAQVLLTPELALSGYGFRDVIGLDWIPVMPDGWTRQFGRRAARHGITPILGTPERDPVTGLLHNSLLVLGPDGDVVGRHRKINVIPAPVEDWATPGTNARPVDVAGIPTGLLICADAYTPEAADRAARGGARLLLSGAAWTPGDMGPAGCWRDRSQETGLPIVVANRTGMEPGSDFRACRSVGIGGGRRRFRYASPDSCVLLIDLERDGLTPRLDHRVALA